jgi:hypothetical protein
MPYEIELSMPYEVELSIARSMSYNFVTQNYNTIVMCYIVTFTGTLHVTGAVISCNEITEHATVTPLTGR